MKRASVVLFVVMCMCVILTKTIVWDLGFSYLIAIPAWLLVIGFLYFVFERKNINIKYWLVYSTICLYVTITATNSLSGVKVIPDKMTGVITQHKSNSYSNQYIIKSDINGKNKNIKAYSNDEYIVGDKIIYEIKQTYYTNNSEFDEYIYDVSHHVYAKGNITNADTTSEVNLYMISNTITNKINSVYSRIFDEYTANFVSSIAIGHNGLLEHDKDVLRGTGVYHIVVVSGMHVGIMYVLFLYLYKKMLKLSRKEACILIIISLIGYCILTGASVSTIRATFICIILQIGNYRGRKNDPITSVAVIGIVLMLINPMILYNVSFVLSFIMAVGLVVFMPTTISLVNLMCRGLPKTFISIVQYVAMCIVSQIIITPLIVYYYGYVYTYSIICNILIVFVIPLVFSLGVASGVLGIINIFVGMVFGIPVYYLVKYIVWVLEFFYQLPYAVVSVGAFSCWWLYVYYALLTVAFAWVQMWVDGKVRGKRLKD